MGPWNRWAGTWMKFWKENCKMNGLFTIVVTFFAGMGAGLGTGFAGLSAAAVISPMLIAFLGMDPYMAVGIALSSDVLASAVSAYTYHKNKNLDIKNGLIMMASVLVFTVVGSYLAGPKILRDPVATPEEILAILPHAVEHLVSELQAPCQNRADLISHSHYCSPPTSAFHPGSSPSHIARSQSFSQKYRR